MKDSQGGFTIIEVLIAIIILSIGVLALSSGAGSVTRMMYTGQNQTRAYAAAASRLEGLRAEAKTTNCGISAGSATDPVSGIPLVWTVGTVPNERRIRMTATYRDGRAGKSIQVFAAIHCP
jgi:prepilin-type N-terminal cleavage/methylation domain-containing protein